MTVEPRTDSIGSLVKLAYDFGLFLFALLFLLVVTRTSHKYYYEITGRTQPPATPSQTAVYRLYFVSSFIFGIVLVIASVGWWIYSNSTEHVLELVLRD